MINTEYFYRRGLTISDVFYPKNPFEKIPLFFYMLIIIVDGFIYYVLEQALSEFDLKKFSKDSKKKRMDDNRIVSFLYNFDLYNKNIYMSNYNQICVLIHYFLKQE